MSTLDSALLIATTAHSGQKRRNGSSYILHCIRVMNQVDTEEEKAVAILHDTLEDSSYKAKELVSLSIPKEIVEAVVDLTKKENEDYDEYIARVANNKLAVKIKLADLKDNMDLLQLPVMTGKDVMKQKKYRSSFDFLKRILNEF